MRLLLLNQSALGALYLEHLEPKKIMNLLITVAKRI